MPRACQARAPEAAPADRATHCPLTVRRPLHGAARIGLHSVFSDKLKAANGVSALLACSSA